MKQLLTIAIIVLLIPCSAMAEGFFGKPIHYGGELRLTSLNFNEENKDDGDDLYETSYPTGGLGGFFDLYWIRLGLGASTTLGTGKRVNSSIFYNKTARESYQSIDGDILLKLPFSFEQVQLWFGAGVLYSYNIGAKSDGSDIKGGKMNDPYAQFGFGLDIYAANNIFISPSLIICQNLDPERGGDFNNSQYESSGSRVDLRVSVGTKL